MFPANLMVALLIGSKNQWKKSGGGRVQIKKRSCPLEGKIEIAYQ